MKKYFGDFAENPALVPQQAQDNSLVSPDGKELDAKVVNGTLIVAEVEQKPKHIYARDLKFGDTGEEVKDIQTRLTELSYYNEKIDGVFGFRTLMGIKSFQQANGISPNGKIDVETFNALFNPPMPVQEANVQTSTSNSNKKKALIAGAGLLGAYLMFKGE